MAEFGGAVLWAGPLVIHYGAYHEIPDVIIKFMMIILSEGTEHSTSLTTAGTRGMSQCLDYGVRI